ncbi:hypothetical protein [Paenibacillus sp. NPDC057934]|uniref:hypothetical protein n=1 Tax=Paenibacillus sp. NPDC057934 TaxID=3346282 RepID=UPI0036DCEF8A
METNNQHEFGNCFVQIMDYVVRHYTGNCLPENVLFAAGSGMLCSFGKKFVDNTSYPYIIGFAGKGYFERASKNLNIRTSLEREPVNAEEAAGKILEYVKNKHIICFQMHENDIGEHPAFKVQRNKNNILNKNFHHVIPVGLDLDKKQIVVWVSASPSSFVCTLPIDMVVQSWLHSVEVFPGSSFFWEGADNSNTQDFSQLEYLKEVSNEILNNHSLPERCFSWFTPSCFGLNAMWQFANELPLWMHNVNSEEAVYRKAFSELVALKADIGYCLTQIHYTVQHVYDNTKNPILSELPDAFLKIAEEWGVISNLFFKASFLESPTLLILRISERIKKNHDQLEKTLVLLNKL